MEMNPQSLILVFFLDGTITRMFAQFGESPIVGQKLKFYGFGTNAEGIQRTKRRGVFSGRGRRQKLVGAVSAGTNFSEDGVCVSGASPDDSTYVDVTSASSQSFIHGIISN